MGWQPAGAGPAGCGYLRSAELELKSVERDEEEPSGPLVLGGRPIGDDPSPEAPLAPQPAPTATPSSRRGLALGALALIVAGSGLLRLEGLTARLWIDEALSVGIASHPVTAIPGLLARDGSPPLYYVVLHLWMAVFGGSEAQTHALSLVFALATVPAAWWAGRSLFGARTGWAAAVLFAANPFLTAYGAETRMYTMVAFLGLMATATFLHAFAFGRRQYLPAFAVLLVLLLYTHNWALFFTASALAAAGVCAYRAPDRRRTLVDAALVFGAAVVAYLPWVPTLVSQARHTGAPWSHRPLVREAVSVLGTVMGDERAVVAFLLAGAGALVLILRGPHQREATAVASTAVIAGSTLALGWVASQVHPAWDARYFAVFVGPVLLLAGLAVAREGTRGLIALALVLTFWVQPLGRLSGLRPTAAAKSDIGDLVGSVEAEVHGGDLVVVMQLEETPVLARYLPGGLRFAAPDGPIAEPELVDWRDATERMRAATPERGLEPLVGQLQPGRRVLLVCARPGLTGYDVEWFRLMRRNCELWKASLASDNRVRAVALPGAEDTAEHLDEYLYLYEKASPGS